MNEVLIFVIVFGAVAAAYLIPGKLNHALNWNHSMNTNDFRKEALGTDLMSNGSENSQTEIAELKKRIQVLETIVTDSKADLKREIDNL